MQSPAATTAWADVLQHTSTCYAALLVSWQEVQQLLGPGKVGTASEIF